VLAAAAGRAEAREVFTRRPLQLAKLDGLPTTGGGVYTDIPSFGGTWGQPFLIGPGKHPHCAYRGKSNPEERIVSSGGHLRAHGGATPCDWRERRMSLGPRHRRSRENGQAYRAACAGSMDLKVRAKFDGRNNGMLRRSRVKRCEASTAPSLDRRDAARQSPTALRATVGAADDQASCSSSTTPMETRTTYHPLFATTRNTSVRELALLRGEIRDLTPFMGVRRGVNAAPVWDRHSLQPPDLRLSPPSTYQNVHRGE